MPRCRIGERFDDRTEIIMDDAALKALVCIAGVIALHFYFRGLVKRVLQDNSYFAKEILEEFERMERVRAEWAESFQRIEAGMRKESQPTSEKRGK